MACDVMSVRLHLVQIRVLEVVEDTPGRACGERRVDVVEAALCAVRVQVPPGA